VLLRDHGPADPWLKLVLFTVNSFMDESGECYPSQESIARAAGMGVSTVRRKVAEASRAHWLAIVSRAVYGGKHWKQYAYRACAPDSIVEDFEPTNGTVTGIGLADTWESQHGGIEAENLTGTMFPQLGKRRIPPATGGKAVHAPPAPSGAKRVQMQARTEAPPARDASTARSRTKHRPLTTEAPPAAGCEVPILSSKEKFQEEGAADAAPLSLATGSGIHVETRTDAKKRMIRALLANGKAPSAILEVLAGYHVTPEDIRREQAA
jgi:hypothetical protein